MFISLFKSCRYFFPCVSLCVCVCVCVCVLLLFVCLFVFRFFVCFVLLLFGFVVVVVCLFVCVLILEGGVFPFSSSYFVYAILTEWYISVWLQHGATCTPDRFRKQ